MIDMLGDESEVYLSDKLFKSFIHIECIERKWMNKFHELSQDEQEELFHKIFYKYDSDEYKLRCSSGKIKNPGYLLSLLPDYILNFRKDFYIYCHENRIIYLNSYLTIIKFTDDPLCPLQCFFGYRHFTI